MASGTNGNRKKPKANTAQVVEELASQGHSILNISRALGISKELFYVWREQYPDIETALQHGKEKERHDLHNALYQSAMKGNVTSAIFLLKARHGYREGDQSDIANKVAITFNLPAASQNVDDYMKNVGSNFKQVGGNDESNY